MGRGGLVISTGAEGPRTESEITNMIAVGKKFYTHSDDEFTPVSVVDGNLKSIKNGTTKDNIGTLPIASFL